MKTDPKQPERGKDQSTWQGWTLGREEWHQTGDESLNGGGPKEDPHSIEPDKRDVATHSPGSANAPNSGDGELGGNPPQSESLGTEAPQRPTPQNQRSIEIPLTGATALVLGILAIGLIATGWVAKPTPDNSAIQATMAALATETGRVRELQTQVAATGTMVQATATGVVGKEATIQAMANQVQATAAAASQLEIAATASAKSANEARAKVGTLEATVAALAPVPPTATAVAQAAATAEAVQVAVVDLGSSIKKMYGPDSGQLNQRSDGRPVSAVMVDGVLRQPIMLRNLEIRATFQNPYYLQDRAWDYGFGFRGTDENDGYRLYVDSLGKWYLDLISHPNGKQMTDSLGSGQIKNMDLSRSGSNRLHLVVSGNTAFFHVNGQLVTALDVSHRTQDAGQIRVVTANGLDHSLSERPTPYRDFLVMALD